MLVTKHYYNISYVNSPRNIHSGQEWSDKIVATYVHILNLKIWNKHTFFKFCFFVEKLLRIESDSFIEKK